MTTPDGGPNQVWLVENCGDSPGRIAAIFATEAEALEYLRTYQDLAEVAPRTVYTTQPENKWYAE